MSYLELALPLLLFLALVGLVRTWRCSTTGNRPWLMTIGILGILILLLNPVAWLLSRPLEIWYKRERYARGGGGLQGASGRLPRRRAGTWAVEPALAGRVPRLPGRRQGPRERAEGAPWRRSPACIGQSSEGQPFTR